MLEDELDKHGDFRTNIDGSLVFEDLLVVIAAVNRAGEMKFRTARIKIDLARFHAYQAKDNKRYMQCIDVAYKTHQAFLGGMAKYAYSYIGLAEEMWKASFAFLKTNPELDKQIKVLEKRVREEVNQKTIKLDRETTIKAYQSLMQKEEDIRVAV